MNLHRAETGNINNHLYRLEKTLTRIQGFHGKGCTVDYSLSEIYSDLSGIGEFLKKSREEKNYNTDELDELTIRHKNLLLKFEEISDEVNEHNNGMVLASKRTIPEFFYHITSRYQKMWKIFEKTAFLAGIGIIVFTLIGLTWFSAYGGINLPSLVSNVSPAIKAFGFIAGLLIGLSVHEFAHGIVLANNGIKIKQIGAMAGSMVGGFIEADEETFFKADRKVHMRFNAASIGTNALLAIFLGLIAIPVSSGFLLFMALGNLFFGIINSFPIIPLDGGWVYEDLIKIYIKNKIVKQFMFSVRYIFFILWIILFTLAALSYN